MSQRELYHGIYNFDKGEIKIFSFLFVLIGIISCFHYPTPCYSPINNNLARMEKDLKRPRHQHSGAYVFTFKKGNLRKDMKNAKQ